MYIPTRRRLPAFLDRTPAFGFSLSLYTSRFKGCPTNLDRFSFSGLVSSTAHRPILIAAFDPRSTNPLRALPLVERTDAGIPSTHALSATAVLSSSRGTMNFSRLSLTVTVFFVTCSSSL